MSGLANMTANFAAPTATGSRINILDELGITRQKKIFSQRTLALVDPALYQYNRNKQFTKMEEEVEEIYKATMSNLKKSGLSAIEIQQMAIQAAMSVHQTQNAILETEYPSNSTSVALQAGAADSFPGMLSAPEILAASPPAKRKAAKRKPAAKKTTK